MLILKIINAKGEEKLIQKGSCLCVQYNEEWQEGDKIKVLLDGASLLAVKFDQTLQESYVYCPNKSLTFTIPTARELQMGYNPQAFQGNKHSIFVREV